MTSTGNTVDTGRIDSLTGLRWWAAFAVFVYHMRVFAPIPIGELAWLGNTGVTFFFILSGFVLTWSWKPTVSRTTFWWRRFARIWPAHMVALLIAIPVFYSVSPDPEQWWVKPFDLGILLLSVVLLQGWWTNSIVHFSGNPAAWSLTYEAFFYFLHPFFQRTLGRMGRRGALTFAGAAIAAAFTFRTLAILFPDWGLGAVPGPIVRVTEFMTGMGLAWAIRSGWRARLTTRLWFPVGGAIFLALGVARHFAESSWVLASLARYTNELVIIVFAVTIVAVVQRDLDGGRSLLRTRPLLALGDMSYAFYLVHATAMYVAFSIFGAQAVGWANLAWWVVVLAAALTLAAGLHYLVERPVERRLRRFWDARQLAKR